MRSNEGNARRVPSVDCPYRLGNGGNDVRGAKQTGFNRADFEIFCEYFDLLADNSRADWFDPGNFTRNFSDDAGDGGQSINPECGKGFQIGLNTGAGTAV